MQELEVMIEKLLNPVCEIRWRALQMICHGTEDAFGTAAPVFETAQNYRSPPTVP